MKGVTPCLISLLASAYFGVAQASHLVGVDEFVDAIPVFVHGNTWAALSPAERAQLRDVDLPAAFEEATRIIRTTVHPSDLPCCYRLVQSGPLQFFNDPGADVLTSVFEMLPIVNTYGDGIFIVSDIANAAAFAFGGAFAIKLPVSGFAFAHERGHNAGLTHTQPGVCSVMTPSTVGENECVLLYEWCLAFQGLGDSSGERCECIAGATGLRPPGTPCELDATTSGVCGWDAECKPQATPLGAEILGAQAGTSNFRSLMFSAYGVGEVGPGFAAPPADAVQSLTFAAARGLLYGTAAQGSGGNDALVLVDKQFGTTTLVAALDRPGVRALTYDPSGDLLLGADSDAGLLLEINPDTGAVTEVGPIGLSPIEGLAFDVTTSTLYAASPEGGFSAGVGVLLEIDRASGAGAPITDVWLPSRGMAFDPEFARLYNVTDVSIEGWAVPPQPLSIGPALIGLLTENYQGLAAITPASCGDGILVWPEQCDDGNTLDGDGCTFDCLFGSIADLDLDGVADGADNCPLVPNPLQEDPDNDLVGSACDVCVDVANPRVAAPISVDPGFPNGWMTLVGGQRDDDADGVGNRCDFKYSGNAGALIAGIDVSDMNASQLHDRAGSDCGTSGDKLCAQFDHDGSGTQISPPDVQLLRPSVFTMNGPSCGPACQRPFDGSIGKNVCEGPEC